MKPVASCSLDLDNKWSYMKTHGDAGWERFPSYLDIVVPRTVELLKQRSMTITYFIVGQDAAIASNHAALRLIPQAGHEVGNHSFHHEPWLHLYTPEELNTELARAEEAIAAATGERTIGFRGPGFSCSTETLETLAARGYRYDASTFPTFIGPLARAYYFFTAKLDQEQKDQRKVLFGNVTDGLRPLNCYQWQLQKSRLLEIPVTTIPGIKAPFHLSYILYLACYSKAIALAYWRTGLAACKAMGVEPSLLLHPLDFLGREDEKDLSFFPAMNMEREQKLDVARRVLDALQEGWDVLPMRSHAELAAARDLPIRRPDFPQSPAKPGQNDLNASVAPPANR